MTPEKRLWGHMIERCTNPNHHAWKNYGGRGITVCDEWRQSFSAFLAHVGPRPTPNHSLDRYPNNDGNYEPGNVRWATRSEQRANSRPIIKARQERAERQRNRSFANFAKSAALTGRDLQRLLNLSETTIELMLSGRKRDPLSAAREMFAAFTRRNKGIGPNILAYIAGGDDFDGGILSKEEWEAAMIVARAVMRKVEP
jgi:hypothetical protein